MSLQQHIVHAAQVAQMDGLTFAGLDVSAFHYRTWRASKCSGAAPTHQVILSKMVALAFHQLSGVCVRVYACVYMFVKVWGTVQQVWQTHPVESDRALVTPSTTHSPTKDYADDTHCGSSCVCAPHPNEFVVSTGNKQGVTLWVMADAVHKAWVWQDMAFATSQSRHWPASWKKNYTIKVHWLQ